ncbi:hypothetical protein H0X48_03555 [Candidatus Dependentiae bacterium]|nr:hypothetical protein [Candidatus Dependentiae bacterium]
MSSILEISKDIKKKLSFNDYNQPASQQGDMPVTARQQASKSLEVKAVEEKASSKIKATYYLSEEDNRALTALYINRLQNNIKTDKSSLICEAIRLLYQKEL